MERFLVSGGGYFSRSYSHTDCFERQVQMDQAASNMETGISGNIKGE